MCTGKVPFEGSDILATLVSLALDQPQEPRKSDGKPYDRPFTMKTPMCAAR
jgi:hypothetical protein